MRKLFALTALSALFAFAACNKPSRGENPGSDGPVVAKFSSDISPKSATRVSDDKWETGDQIGIFMLPAGATQNAIHLNIPYTASPDGNLTPSGGDGIAYPETGNVDITAYYPYTYEAGDMATDLADQSGGLVREILYSNNIRNQAPTESVIPLTFRYSLAKINVTVTAEDGSGITGDDLAGMTASIDGMATAGTPDIMTGNWATGNSGIIHMYNTGSSGTAATFEALVFPTTESADAGFTFNIAGRTYTYSVNGKRYQSGYEYDMEFVFIADEPRPSLVMSAAATIAPREKGEGGRYVIDDNGENGSGNENGGGNPRVSGEFTIEFSGGSTFSHSFSGGSGDMDYWGKRHEGDGSNANEVFLDLYKPGGATDGSIRIGFEMMVSADRNRIMAGTYSYDEDYFEEFTFHGGVMEYEDGREFILAQGNITVEISEGLDIYTVTVEGCAIIEYGAGPVGRMAGTWSGPLDWVDKTI